MCDVNIRLLKDIEEDYKLLEKWYQEEEIYSSFEQRKLNYKEIKDYFDTKDTIGIPQTYALMVKKFVSKHSHITLHSTFSYFEISSCILLLSFLLECTIYDFF